MKVNVKKLLLVILIIFLLVATIIYKISKSKSSQHRHVESPDQKEYILNKLKRNKLLPQLKNNCSLKEATPSQVQLDGNYYPAAVPPFKNQSIDFDCLNAATDQFKLILLWTGYFNVSRPFNVNSCPVKNCAVTFDKSFVNDAHMVVSHMLDEIDEPPMPRKANQQWIFLLYESPLHSKDLSRYDGMFNLTSTYLVDSHFAGFYENFARMDWTANVLFNEEHDFHSQKTLFATAVISNCGAPSRRLDFIHELKQFIDIDVFGACGRPCPQMFKNKTIADCKDILGEEYKFYLAFENSVCKDYITEKFFSILRYNIIPVVLGGGDYARYVSESVV